VRYRFDLALARGPLVVIGYLGVVMLAIIALASTILWGAGFKGVNGGPAVHNPGEAFWQALLRVLDSGTFASDSSWPTRIISLAVTLAGIFLAGRLIGLIVNAVDQQIEQLRKGRSAVLETDHTLIIGWSPRLPTILTELVAANANRGGRRQRPRRDGPRLAVGSGLVELGAGGGLGGGLVELVGPVGRREDGAVVADGVGVEL
jgi:hypothetical protein